MKNSIKVELKEYILEGIQELKIDNLTSKPGRLDANELHQELFNQDYYIIGYFNAQQWMDKHFIDIFEGLEDIKEYEIANFGEAKHYTNAESMVNMLVYIYGEELIHECFEEIGLM
tara:strand:- start:498 stop:845 length:348 start_codon:yes stop_codon:yes gene_type:complete